jgi:hypothetical protein
VVTPIPADPFAPAGPLRRHAASDDDMDAQASFGELIVRDSRSGAAR